MSDHYDPSIDMDLFYENQEKPWWWYRCTHRSHAYWYDPEGQEYGCWRVLREAEQVAILKLICLPQVHLCISIDGVGSICKTFSEVIFGQMSEPELLALVVSETRDLKTVLLH